MYARFLRMRDKPGDEEAPRGSCLHSYEIDPQVQSLRGSQFDTNDVVHPFFSGRQLKTDFSDR